MQVKKLKIRRVADVSENMSAITKSKSRGKRTVGTSINITKGLGKRLQSWRKENGYTLHGLAKIIGVTVGPLSEVENNKNLPSLETVAALHNHTNLNILWLLFNQGPTNK
jgi:DNA-binding XRE family transcriptional regulator